MLSSTQLLKVQALRKKIADAQPDTGKTLIMGVLNVTPDSFSDGGLYCKVDSAIAYSIEMVANGADIIDVGGESTRPATFAAEPSVCAAEELSRVIPVIQALTKALPDIPLSIDTYRAETAQKALMAGAVMINDVSAARADPEMPTIMAKSSVPVCLMHMLGLPNAISIEPEYHNVTNEVKSHLIAQVQYLLSKGVLKSNIILDPGIGFGKTVEQNLQLLRELQQLVAVGYPVLVGTSRKSFIGKVLGGLPADDRIAGTAATVALSVAYGASIIRVHDVREMARVCRMTDAIVNSINTN